MAIADDVSIDYANEIVSRATGASSTVYSVNALYSYLQDTFDELTQMDDETPMSAQTPTSYTMTFGWYIQEELTKYLTGGAIQTDGYTDEIRTISFGATYTNAVASDVGKAVTGGTTGDSGVLLDYDNTAKKWWVRMDAADDLFDQAETVSVTSGTGTGTSTGASITGEHIFANPYTLGTLQGSPELYIYQNGSRITSWWSAGHFDVLLKVTESDVDIDSKAVTVFARNWTDTYSTFNITLTTAGQNAVPLGTSDDLNNQSASGTIEDYTDGTTATVAIDFAFGTPFQYDIGDGAGNMPYNVQIDCDTQALSAVYEVCKWWTMAGATGLLEWNYDSNTIAGEAYRQASGSYAEVTASPLGTYAGGTFFGARGVYLTNLHPDDVQNFQLIDASGVTRNPPNYQSIAVAGLVSGDRVGVYLASSGAVDKTQYTMTVQASGAGTVTVAESIPTDTPATGYVIVVATGVEDHYAYSSWTGSAFTLAATTSRGYAGTDTAYVPYILRQADATTESETLVYVSDRSLIVKVRVAGIIPFVTTGTFSSTGYSTTAIRTTDSIYTA